MDNWLNKIKSNPGAQAVALGLAGVDYGDHLRNVDAIRTAKLGQQFEENRLADQQRQLQDETAARGLRSRAFGGDRDAIAGLAATHPKEAVEFLSYFDGLAAEKRNSELAAAEAAIDTTGRIAAFVKSSDNPEQAYAAALQSMPEGSRKSLPKSYSPQAVDWMLAQAMDTEKLIEMAKTSQGDRDFAGLMAEFGGGAQPAQGATGGGVETIPASVLRDEMIARGLPEHVADGFVLNMQDESGLRPGINEQNPTVKGSRGGYGLYQLTGPRRAAFEQWASQSGKALDDPGAQLDFLAYELQGPEKAAANKIMATSNSGEAAAAIATYFLRPSAKHLAARVAKYTAGGDKVVTGQEAPAEDQDGTLTRLRGLYGSSGLTDPQREVIGQLIEEMKPAEPSDRYRNVGDNLVDLTAQGGPQTVDFGAPEAGPDFGAEEKLRKEFVGLPPVKNFMAQSEAMSRIEAGASDPSAAGDLSLIFAYMKLLDPGSVVREQEFANAQNAAGVPDQVRNIWNRLLSGERLAPDQRQDFVTRAGKIYEGAKIQYDAIADQYRGIAGAQGIDEDRSVPRFGFTGELAAGGGQEGPVQVNTVEEYNALLPGAAYIDPQGKPGVKR